VDREAIMGRPVVIYWSIKGDESEYADDSLTGRIQSILSALIHLPSEARWGRTMRLVH
jgi:hypothetical protein